MRSMVEGFLNDEKEPPHQPSLPPSYCVLWLTSSYGWSPPQIAFEGMGRG